jgi:hypothetical protein
MGASASKSAHVIKVQEEYCQTYRVELSDKITGTKRVGGIQGNTTTVGTQFAPAETVEISAGKENADDKTSSQKRKETRYVQASDFPYKKSKLVHPDVRRAAFEKREAVKAHSVQHVLTIAHDTLPVCMYVRTFVCARACMDVWM